MRNILQILWKSIYRFSEMLLTNTDQEIEHPRGDKIRKPTMHRWYGMSITGLLSRTTVEGDVKSAFQRSDTSSMPSIN